MCTLKGVCQYILFDVGGVNTRDQSNVEGVEDRSNTPKGCHAMYVEDVEDGKRTYTHSLANFQSAKSFEKLRLKTIPSDTAYIKAC